MKTIVTQSRMGPYPIVIGKGLLKRAGRFARKLEIGDKVMVVSDARVTGMYFAPLRRSLAASGFKVSLYLLPEGERAKSQEELFKIYGALVREGFERRDAVMALGGGVAGDVAGFAAATYMRGVPFINAGTTLLAQVDSAIGGKTAVNLPEGKNLVGVFYAPRLVLSDVGVLGSLPEREFRASLAEVVKYGVIRAGALFGFLEREADRILKKDAGPVEKIVAGCARIKSEVVTRDEFEVLGLRMILNYGHTFGHAFEQVLGYGNLAHGEAVAAGMACAARLAVHLKLFSPAGEERQAALLRKFRLPVSLAGLSVRREAALEAMLRDKKKRAGRLTFVLPVRIGKVVLKSDIPLNLVRKVLAETGAV